MRSLDTGIWISTPENFISEPERTVCITGHRSKNIVPFRNDPAMLALTAKCVYLMLCRYIDLAFENGYDTFIDGFAQGTDLWAANHIINKKRDGCNIRLIGAVPFLRHSERFSAKDREMLKKAEMNSSCIVCTNSDPDIVYSTLPLQKDLYRTRNYFMADNASVAIAFLNHDARRSGTGQTVAYLQSQHKKIALFGCDDVHRLMGESGGDIGEFASKLEKIPDPFKR